MHLKLAQPGDLFSIQNSSLPWRVHSKCLPNMQTINCGEICNVPCTFIESKKYGLIFNYCFTACFDDFLNSSVATFRLKFQSSSGVVSLIFFKFSGKHLHNLPNSFPTLSNLNTKKVHPQVVMQPTFLEPAVHQRSKTLPGSNRSVQFLHTLADIQRLD